MDQVNHPNSVIDRFWKYTDKKDADQCWPWIGSKKIRGGYGQLNDRGKILSAHRLSFEIHKGAIKERAMICHSCGNAVCVNPYHLYQGDAATNNRDSKNHGTLYKFGVLKGEKSPNAKLTKKEVLFIKNSNLKGPELARKFNLTKQAIYSIKKGKTWKSLI